MSVISSGAIAVIGTVVGFKLILLPLNGTRSPLISRTNHINRIPVSESEETPKPS